MAEHTSDELKLIGLQALSQDLWKQYEAVTLAAAKITGETDEDGSPHLYGHTSDWLNGEGRFGTAKALIKHLHESTS